MKKSDRAVVAKFVMRGKEHLALIRSYGDALILHTMHYADEIRSPKELSQAKAKVQASELKLAERLIDDLSEDRFDVGNFEDTYRQRILNFARQKAAGHETELPQVRKEARTVDLMTVLKKSLKAHNGKDANQTAKKDERTRSDRHGKKCTAGFTNTHENENFASRPSMRQIGQDSKTIVSIGDFPSSPAPGRYAKYNGIPFN
jgi:DNA end-binding protein Ku